MRYVFDPAKDKANFEKHGVSLVLAEILFRSIRDRLFVCVNANRDEERWVISLRKANSREVKRYG